MSVNITSRIKPRLKNFVYMLLVLLVLLFIYLPVAWLIISSISTRAELLNVPINWIPRNPTFHNYINILMPGADTTGAAQTFRITLRNSLIVSTSVTLISLVVGSLAAYALVRIRFHFNEIFMIGLIATRMIPEISLVIPLYILASRVHILNTPFVLIATYLCFSLPFAIWLMAAFFETIPLELEDAALIDAGTKGRAIPKNDRPVYRSDCECPG